MSSPRKKKKRGVGEVYQRKTPLEHILLRPDTYIGSVEKETQCLWVYNEETCKMVKRDISFVPGLYKIFDEILVNAADNKQRDPAQKEIRVEVNKEQGYVSVKNDGKGIPVEIHPKENIYVPELIFGNLLTSSNYNDAEKKTVGGRNGYGAKLANIFSTEFTVETVDSSLRLKYKQTWKNNMSQKAAPEVTESHKPSYTKVTFYPDFPKFGMRAFDNDTYRLFVKRVYDIAGTARGKMNVYFNKRKVLCNSFETYCELFLAAGEEKKKVYEKLNDRWEVCIATTDGQFETCAHVNNIWTIKGGSHVNAIMKQITNKLMKNLSSKKKGISVRACHIKNYTFCFINCLIENPAFSSQTKEILTLKASKFGSTFELNDKFYRKVMKLDLKGHALSHAKFAADRGLKKNDGKAVRKLTGIPKLDDANNAGKRGKSENCTLILTEGDSAKALAMAGIEVVGRDHYGAFPLKGKVLNVRDANSAQVQKNSEISNIKKIIGLKNNTDYSNDRTFKTLRYGSLMIMTDQDHDGSHIKGLLVNFISAYWPSLLRRRGFMREFITPIVVATKKGKSKERLSFFTIPEYERWVKTTDNGKGYDIKYYKGLGTSKNKEAKMYFSNLRKHVKDFRYTGGACDNSIDMAFNKKRADDRKRWLSDFREGTYLDQSVASITYNDFINKELILFSMADNIRSIPSVVDGFKPGQRKILFSCFKRKLKKEIKVVQLGGYVSEHAAYHHGEVSLVQTIIGMAQNFVGSNNINLLYPSGQFGTRDAGGKNASAPRYIFTKLCPIARTIFHEADDSILDYQNDDGFWVEPAWYCPVIPLVLVNGAEGIGTGYSTFLPQYNPTDIVKNLRRMIRGEEPEPMTPWYNGWTGRMLYQPNKNTLSYATVGRVEALGPRVVAILELPVRTWTEKYKADVFEKMKEKNLIEDVRCYSEGGQVCFHVEFSENFDLSGGITLGFMKQMKLISSLGVSNIMLFDRDGKIRKYESALEILKDFFDLRLTYYDKRKEALKKKLMEELKKLTNQMKFILAVVNGELKIMKRPRKDICRDMLKMGFDRIYPKLKKTDNAKEEAKEKFVQEAGQDSLSQGYNYLLKMPIYSLTLEKVEEIKTKRAEKLEELDILCKTPIQDIWLKDLDNFEKALEEHEKEKQESLEDDEKIKKKKQKTKRRKKGLLDNFNKKGGTSNETTDYDAILNKLLVTEEAKTSKGSKKRRKKTATAGKTLEDATPGNTPATSLDSAPITGFFKKTKGMKTVTKKKKPLGKKTSTSQIVDFTAPSSSKSSSAVLSPKKRNVTDFFKPRSSASASPQSDSDSDSQLDWAQRLAQRLNKESQQTSDSSSDEDFPRKNSNPSSTNQSSVSKPAGILSLFKRKPTTAAVKNKLAKYVDDDSSSEDVPLTRPKRTLNIENQLPRKRKKLDNPLKPFSSKSDDSDDDFNPPNHGSDYDAGEDPFNF